MAKAGGAWGWGLSEFGLAQGGGGPFSFLRSSNRRVDPMGGGCCASTPQSLIITDGLQASVLLLGSFWVCTEGHVICAAAPCRMAALLALVPSFPVAGVQPCCCACLDASCDPHAQLAADAI